MDNENSWMHSRMYRDTGHYSSYGSFDVLMSRDPSWLPGQENPTLSKRRQLISPKHRNSSLRKTRAERDKLERDFPKVHEFQGKRIKLNVGGKIFVTTLQTLTKDPDSMLASMFSGRFEMSPDEDGCFFIDRDSKHFRRILNYLRTGQIVLPEKESAKTELLLEAEFYNIKPFREALKEPALSFNGSTLLDTDKQKCLFEWLGRKQMWNLIYRASRDGFRAADFHRCCDGKGETVSVVKTTGGYLFGSYTDVSWSSQNQVWKTSTQSFLFAFKSHLTGNSPHKLALSGAHNDYAVLHNPNYGIIFGNGGAIQVADNSSTKSCASNWNNGDTYQFPPGVTNNYWLVGENAFAAADIEVFSCQTNN